LLILLLDYEKLLPLVPSSQASSIRSTISRLVPRKEAAQKEEMGEMMDKLKGIGNSILGTCLRPRSDGAALNERSGNFGLSTDNFKFEPNQQGGYSVNFSR
jgi:hypothetical protein